MREATRLRATSVVLGMLLLASACARSSQPYRIAVATFSHETCTFCPDSTGVAEWEYYGPPQRGEPVLRMSGYIRGFVERAREYGGVELVGILSPRGAKGGSSGSWVTRAAFDKYSDGIAQDIRERGPFDGVFLALHGAMAVAGVPKPEAELVRRVRAVVGPDVPIMVTLDLHANEDHELADAADGVFIVKRYPHYDASRQGGRAARLMLRTLRGEYRPTMAVRKPGVLTPSVFQWTGEAPAMDIMERARRWEDRAKDAYVSVAFGFAYADVPDVGATVMVITNDDQPLADSIAQDMSDYIWRVRERFAGKRLPKTVEGVRQAIAAERAGQTPVVLADHSDRTGNSSQVLAELIRQGASRFVVATLADSLAIRALASQGGEGAHVAVDVGGYADRFAGQPVHLDGVLEYLGPYAQFDTMAVVRFGNDNRVILTPVLHQVTDPGILEHIGLDPRQVGIVVLKSRVHFRRGYDETGLAGRIVVVDAPGLGPADLSTVPYRNAPVGELYPLGRQ
ncbi:MAG: M81 family metallopeptidase [Gemmatimonadota bacterium]|jgi:microcystin degradation protein MlrC